MVKVLMAHGFGTNAGIFEAQTGMAGPERASSYRSDYRQEQLFPQFAVSLSIIGKAEDNFSCIASLRALLPPHWEYYFLQGPLECGPAPGIGEIYANQKYYCYYDIPSLTEIRSVHVYLEDVIEDEGPFDMAWGFSGGGMIICSLLLHYARSTPHLPPPFRCAIFMNCPMPWSATPELGKDVTPLVIQRQNVPCTLTETDRMLALEHEKHASKEEMLKNAERKANDWVSDDLLQPMIKHPRQKIHAQTEEQRVEPRYEDYIAHRIFPEVDKVRVGVPTGHILGERDPIRESSLTMSAMCDARVMLTYKHGFGHEIPTRSPRDLMRIKELIEKTVIRSEFA